MRRSPRSWMRKMPGASCDLLDVSVWLPLADRHHAWHARATHYWQNEAASEVAFCGVSLLGLLRLGTQPVVMRGEPFTPPEIWRVCTGYLQMPNVRFLEEPAGIVAQMRA